MKFIKTSTPVLLILIFFACNKPPCNCDFVDISSITFKVLNQQDQNLVFGPQRIFSKDSIQFLKGLNNFSIHTASVSRSYYDSSSLTANFYKNDSKTYIYYNQQTPPDSIEVEWEQKQGKCCGSSQSYLTIKSYKLNNASPQIQNGVLLITK